MFQQAQAASGNNRLDESAATEEAVDRFEEGPYPTPSMGEMLYPGFNSIVPHMVELVIPNLNTLTSKEA